MRTSFFGLLMVLALVGLFTNGVLNVSAQAPGMVVIISSDATWTKANSPHELTGPLLVSQGVTLTIEAGTTIELNGYELRVNGTLRAIGTGANRIVFENGEITFTEYSNAWDAQTGTGSIIQFAVFEDVEVVKSVPVSINENPVSDDNLWTKEESPIEFTGTVVVDSGETLTVEAGVTVDLKSFELIVKGTLHVLGTSSDKVTFKSGNILFTETSNGWDEQTSSGCIIDNADISYGELISNVSLKITNSKIERLSVCCSSILSGNEVYLLLINGGSPVISGNNIYSISRCYGTPKISNNTINEIGGHGGSPTISDNTITQIGKIRVSPNVTSIDYLKADSPTITNNIIKNWICLNATGYATVSYHTITGHDYTFQYEKGLGFYTWWETETAITSGIMLEGNVHVFANTIENCYIGIRGGTVIEGNLLINNNYGLQVRSDATIKNNTFTNNNETITIGKNPSSVAINYNNFESVTQDIIRLYTMSKSIDATNNWWGTVDTQAINLTIHDFKYDFDLGKVSFIPILSEPNPNAEPESISMIPEFSSWFVLPFAVIGTVLLLFYKNKVHK